MYIFNFRNTDNINQYEELIKEFLQPSEYRTVSGEECEYHLTDKDILLEYEFDGDKDNLKRSIFRDLCRESGKKPGWGILTGIRPVKLAYEIMKRGDNPRDCLEKVYMTGSEKARLTEEILNYQLETIGRPDNKSLSMYIGIPFCPTRCLYCSFTSNQVDDAEIGRYVEALQKEIDFASGAVKKAGYRIESLYFGGGTPTTLSAEQLDMLMKKVGESFDLGGLKEFTVEAGRPDTITEEKLLALKSGGVDRISINPQTMKDKTLELIGRRHSVEDVYNAFEIARSVGFNSINTDLIAGLPGETFHDFRYSLEEIIKLDPSNITLHTLAVKRASRLKEVDENFNYVAEELREEMLDYAHKRLRETGFRPYYLYRQKHTSGNTENTGFCKDDKVSTYNIRIMEEAQSILALGAGGISKIYFPEENRLERVANVSNYEIYIERINEMLERKAKGFFMIQEDETC